MKISFIACVIFQTNKEIKAMVIYHNNIFKLKLVVNLLNLICFDCSQNRCKFDIDHSSTYFDYLWLRHGLNKISFPDDNEEE